MTSVVAEVVGCPSQALTGSGIGTGCGRSPGKGQKGGAELRSALQLACIRSAQGFGLRLGGLRGEGRSSGGGALRGGSGADWAACPPPARSGPADNPGILSPPPSQWASLEVAAPPPATPPGPGHAGTRSPAWVGGGTGTALATGAAEDRPCATLRVLDQAGAQVSGQRSVPAPAPVLFPPCPPDAETGSGLRGGGGCRGPGPGDLTAPGGGAWPWAWRASPAGRPASLQNKAWVTAVRLFRSPAP